ncbi:hypothetical protein ACKGJN_13880 [Gillisia sp. Q332]|uniref:hypothetical protein n=1 Tax=Gillisia xinjiangensis TaxID=3384765 RepID=UPI0039190F2B
MEKNKFTFNPKSGFKVPENYFEDFESNVLDSLSLEPEMLKTIEKDSGFKVPLDYFETLENNIYARIENSKSKGRVIPMYRKRKLFYYVAVAAIFVGLISTLLFNPVQENSFNSIELSAIEAYMDSGNMDFNYNEISSIIYEEDYVFDNITKSNLSDDAVFEYLKENMEDPSIILE